MRSALLALVALGALVLAPAGTALLPDAGAHPSASLIETRGAEDAAWEQGASAVERGFKAAERLLEENAGLPAPAWAHAAQKNTLALGESLLRGDTDGDSLSLALDAAKKATRWQANMIGMGASYVAPTLETESSASAAAFALLNKHGVEATPEQRAELEALDLQPQAFQQAFARLLAAFMAFEDATQSAYANVELNDLMALSNYFQLVDAGLIGANNAVPLTQSLADLFAEARIGFGPLLAARNQFLDAVQDFSVVMDETTLVEVPTTSGAVAIAPVLAYDLHALINSFYDENFILVIDAEGNDVYHNNAGGSNVFRNKCYKISPPVVLNLNPIIKIGDSLVGPGVAALIDLGGNDQYGDPLAPRGCGQNGGGSFGAGVLIDRAGNDDYVGTYRGVAGGAHFGAGLLVDSSGNDDYRSTEQGVNGGGHYIGLGLLVDNSENDLYLGTERGVNGGGHRGVGSIIDGNGQDTFIGTDIAVNGGGYIGVGSIIDQSGDDTYVAGDNGANGGGQYGVGLILDVSENDQYTTASGTGTEGAGFVGLGLILDLGGQDDFSGTGEGTVVPNGILGARIDIPHLPPI
ncbi:MAG: hypothetical protein ACPGQL_04785 [Thermoplasmatota archaeon]